MADLNPAIFSAGGSWRPVPYQHEHLIMADLCLGKSVHPTTTEGHRCNRGAHFVGENLGDAGELRIALRKSMPARRSRRWRRSAEHDQGISARPSKNTWLRTVRDSEVLRALVFLVRMAHGRTSGRPKSAAFVVFYSGTSSPGRPTGVFSRKKTGAKFNERSTKRAISAFPMCGRCAMRTRNTKARSTSESRTLYVAHVFARPRGYSLIHVPHFGRHRRCGGLAIGFS